MYSTEVARGQRLANRDRFLIDEPATQKLLTPGGPLPEIIYVAIHNERPVRAFASEPSELYSWMERMGFDDQDFRIEEVGLVR